MVVLGVQAGFLGVVLFLGFRHAPRARAFPLDALALPGAEARIGIQIRADVSQGPGAGLPGVPVSLGRWDSGDLPWDPISPAERTRVTDDDGVALWTFPAPQRSGILTLEVEIAEGSRERVAETTCRVLLGVVAADSPVVLVKVPDVIRSELEEAPGAGPEGAARRSSAPGVLADLGRHAAVAYLVDSGWQGARAVDRRLEERGFPLAPVLGRTPVEDGAALPETLARLELSRWTGPRWAIIESQEEAGDFLASGFRVVILGPAPGVGREGRAISAARSWQDVREKILED